MGLRCVSVCGEDQVRLRRCALELHLVLWDIDGAGVRAGRNEAALLNGLIQPFQQRPPSAREYWKLGTGAAMFMVPRLGTDARDHRATRAAAGRAS
jgi:hypothetical protein